MKANIYFIFSILLFMSGCKKEDKIGFLSNNLKYPLTNFNADVGAILILTPAMTLDGSTLPLTFSIDAIRKSDGTLATELMNYKVDTYFWHDAFSGREIDQEEVNAKREKANRPAIDINPSNGQIIIYPEATDSTKLTKGTYIVDIRVKNSSEERLIKSALTISVNYALPYHYEFLGVDGLLDDVQTVFTRLSDDKENKLIIKFIDKDNNPIDPKSLTGVDYGDNGIEDIKDWKNLGFKNQTKYTEYLDRIEVEVKEFPLPYIPENYITFNLYNLGSINGDFLNFAFEFAIYKPGTWLISIKLVY